MKRVGFLWKSFVSEQNIIKAIEEVNKSHRTIHGRLNKTVYKIEKNKTQVAKQLKEMIEKGFQPSPTKEKEIFDRSAEKIRKIHEPPLFPDQYIHHALIQVLEPIMMKRMDYWCCASIKGRGTKRGIAGIKKWLKDKKNTRFAAELDIYHFYENLKSKVVLNRMEKLIKDQKILNFIKILISSGITIGAYFSQWFANTVLQEIDFFVRHKLKIKYYIRYMDNLTLFCANKKYLHYCVKEINKRLSLLQLKLKSNWQVFPTEKRMVNALGYRFNRNFILLRKRSVYKLKRHYKNIKRKIIKKSRISFCLAAGFIARVGQLKFCNNYNILNKYIGFETIIKMKKLISKYRRNLNARSKFQQIQLSWRV